MNISIMGDSISTFEGYNPAQNAVFYDSYACQVIGIDGVEDAWWHQVITALNANLLVNESFSGSLVTGEEFPAGCSVERTSNLSRGEVTPDLILVYLGINDFGYATPVGDLATFPKKASSLDANLFADAYAKLILALKENYPNTDIVCGTLMRAHAKGAAGWSFPLYNAARITLDEYNDAIKKVAPLYGAHLALLDEASQTYEGFDGLHPTKEGHRTLARAWIERL